MRFRIECCKNQLSIASLFSFSRVAFAVFRLTLVVSRVVFAASSEVLADSNWEIFCSATDNFERRSAFSSNNWSLRRIKYVLLFVVCAMGDQ